MERPTAFARARCGISFVAVATLLWSGPALAAPPAIDRASSSPVTAVTSEELQKLPLSRDLRTILDYHNQLRGEVGARPLRWNPELAAGAAAYGPELSQGGSLRHSSRQGRKLIRENLLQSPRGHFSPLQMVQFWGREKRTFRPGTFPNVTVDGNTNRILHYSQMIWPTTTDLGCAIYSDRAFDWLICRYSPPGNKDGRAVGPGALDPTQLQAGQLCSALPGRPIQCQNAPDEDGEEGGEEADNGGASELADDNGAPGQNQDGGATRERVPQEPTVAGGDDGISRVTGNCSASVIAKIRIVEPADPNNPNKKRRTKESHNLAHGFSEIVIPYGWDAAVIFKPDPNPAKTYQAPGTMTASWGIVGQPNPHGATVTGDYAKLAAGWDREWGLMNINPAVRPTVQQHRIDAEWDPQPETDPTKCPTGHDFTVTFAGEIPTPGPLDTKDFVEQAGGAGFPGTRARERTSTGTRAIHEGPQPRTFSRNNNVVVPIGVYWDLPENCCDIKRAKRKVIQFARAAIHGPNGRQGKGWGLDILPSELERARGRTPTHNPTYGGHPRSDGDETPTADGAGGTRSIAGDDLLQWDAPGMPKDLFDRLHAAQGPSVYRQQFLSLLVCRPAGANQVQFYLARGKVCRVAITTVRWDFPGQQGVQPRPARRRGDPPEMPYRQPVISVSFDVRDGHCADLRAFLNANGLLEAFEHPGSDARNLEILPPNRYQELDTSVTNWEADPFADIQFP